MKSMLLSAVAVLGLAVAAGCTTTTTSDGGEGGSGEGGSGQGGTTNVTTGTGTTLGSCDDLPCSGENGCIACSVLGDSTTAVDGGICAADFIACFGTDDAGTGGSPDCIALYDCFEACQANNPNDEAAELDCICSNDGTQCTQTQSDANTCLGAPGGIAGLQLALAWETCAFDDACPNACAQ